MGWNSKTDKSPSDDESVDELAENSPPLYSTQPLAPISRKGITSRAGPTRLKSNESMQESIDKPLPPIALQVKSDAKVQVRRPLQALRVKTTNLQIPNTNRTLSIRPKLATSSSQDSNFGARRALVEEQGNERFKNPPSTSFETEDLSKKISGLMQAATVADPRSNGKKFSNAISGLAQNPVVDTFSSSSIDHSTPKIRLDPTPAPTQSDTKTPKEVQRSPSIIEFSFERSDADGTSSPSVSPVTVADTSGDELGLESGGKDTRKSSTQSVKRKSSEVDLRSHLHPDSKRPKTLFAKDDSAPVKHLDGLATKGNSATVHDVLGERDPNTKMLPRPNTAEPKNSTSKGIDIFQVPKGKGPERLGGRSKSNLFPPPISVTHQSAALEPVKRASGRPLGPGCRGSRPDISISRPTGILFSRDGRESRGVARARREREKVREGNRSEEMEIDELAM